MATLAKVREKAAKKLGLFGTGQQLESKIDDDLTEGYTELYEELESLGLALWAQTDAVPDVYVSSIVAWLAASRVNEYAVPPQRYAQIVAEGSRAEAKLRRLQAQPLQGETEHENY